MTYPISCLPAALQSFEFRLIRYHALLFSEGIYCIYPFMVFIAVPAAAEPGCALILSIDCLKWECASLFRVLPMVILT